MGGWYSDAFDKTIGKINSTNIVRNNSNVYKNFGEAFDNIGAMLNERELTDSKLKSEELNQTLKKQDIDTNAENWVQKQDDQAYLSAAFSRPNKASFENNYKVDDTNMPSAEAVSKANEHFDKKEKELLDADIWAQKEFNSDAIKKASDYSDYKTFAKDNPTLIQSADGTTVQGIKDKLNNNKTELNALKTQKIINDLSKKVNKAEIKALMAEQKKNFKYTQETGTKIVSLVKTSLGMDSDMFELDDNKREEFNTMVTGVDTLSKKYNLEPIQAYKLYLEKTAKKNEDKIEETKPTWADYK